MTIEHAVWLGQQALTTVLLVSAPPMLAALFVGVLVSMVQTVTQLQEVTLSFIPKILGVFLVLAVTGSWMLEQTVAFGVQMFDSIPEEGAP